MGGLAGTTQSERVLLSRGEERVDTILTDWSPTAGASPMTTMPSSSHICRNSVEYG